MPGIAGQQTVLTDGAQIPSDKVFNANAISELTMGNGVQMQGRTSGTAIEAGKVGESYSSAIVSVSNFTYAVTRGTNVWGTDITKVINKGVYAVTVKAYIAADDTVNYARAMFRLRVNGSGGSTNLDDYAEQSVYRPSGASIPNTGVVIHKYLTVLNDNTTLTVDSAVMTGSTTLSTIIQLMYHRIA